MEKMWTESKQTNKEIDNSKLQESDCVLHDTTCHTERLYQIQTPTFRSSCEIFEINIVTEKAKHYVTILQFVYRTHVYRGYKYFVEVD